MSDRRAEMAACFFLRRLRELEVELAWEVCLFLF